MIGLATLILLLSLALAYKDPTEWYPYGLSLLSFIVIFGKIFLSLGKKIFDYLLKRGNIEIDIAGIKFKEKESEDSHDE